METTQQRLADAIAPFQQAVRSYPRSPDDAVWLETPDFRLIVGDLRRIVREVERANA